MPHSADTSAQSHPSTLRLTVVGPLMLGVAVVGSQMFIVSPLLPDMARDLGVTASTIGASVAGGSLATGVMAALAAPFLDRYPRRNVLISGLLLLALAVLGVALAPTALLFGVAFAAAGAVSGILLPTTYAIASDIAAESERGRLLGLVLLGWSVSFLLQPFVAELGDTLGWRGAYGVVAAAAVLAALLDLGLPARRASGLRAGYAASYAAAFRVPTVRPLLVACVFMMFAFYGCYPYWGAAYRQLFGGDASAASLLAVGYGAGFLVGGLNARLIDRLTPWRMLAVALLCCSGIYLLLPLALGSSITFIAWCVCLGILNNLSLTSLVAAFAAASPPQRGSVLALYAAMTYVGFALGAGSMGPVFEARGLGVVALVSSGALFIAFLLALLVLRLRRVRGR